MNIIKKAAGLLFLSSIVMLLLFTACNLEDPADTADPTDTVEPVYTVTYSGNGNTGGTLPAAGTAYEEGTTVTVLGNTGSLTKTGSTFAGWNDAADGNGTGYAAGVTFTMGAVNLTLYAKWTLNPTYTVTYDGHGETDGTVPVDSNSYEEGEMVTVLGNTGKLLNIDGATTAYRFENWNTVDIGTGMDYVADDTFTMGSSNLTLHAQWTPYVLRDTGPAGGLIFHIEADYTKGWRYLEAAPASTEWDAQWSDPHESLIGTNPEIGDGQANTTAIVAALNVPDPAETGRAAQLCDALEVGIYDDWFMPSKEELNTMSLQLAEQGVGDFTNNIDYWSSSEYNSDPTNAWFQYFISIGGEPEVGFGKAEVKRVRAVRDF